MIFTKSAKSADIAVSFSQNYGAGGYALHIRLSGEITEGDRLKLEQALATEKPKASAYIQNRLLYLESPGGSLDAAISVANLVKKQAINTYIEAEKKCLSACAIIFMSGADFAGDKFRLANRTLHPKGVLGFHAPFAFTKTDNLDPEVARLLSRDAERGGTIAASKLVKLTLDNTLPASLVEELLQYEEDRFLYIDTIDRAGRWDISLVGERLLKNTGQTVGTQTRKKLSAHCNNLIHWNNDISHTNRQDQYKLDVGELFFGGHDNECSYRVSDDHFAFAVNQKFGNVKDWQTLPAQTKLSSLLNETSHGNALRKTALSNTPPQTLAGACESGFQWIGGWSGATFTDSIAYAYYRHCASGQIPFKLECIHGTDQINTRISLPSFGIRSGTVVKIASQTDNNLQLLSNGKIVNKNGIDEYSSTLTRNDFTFKQLKGGSQHFISINGQRFAIHLSGASKAIQAMENSCL